MINADSRPEANLQIRLRGGADQGGLSWRKLVSGKNEIGSVSQAPASKVIHLAVVRSSGKKWGRTQDRHRGPSLE